MWSKNKLVLILLVLVTFLSFLKKGNHDLQEWDESRNGLNAYEMLENGDYVNLYYNGELDTWNAKPPLMIWLIAGSYKVFGFNEFALRFPSTLCTIIFFMLCFYTLILLESAQTAFFTCVVLISSKAIFGNHIGLTGDFDALLLVFITASVYFFILYVEKQYQYGVFLTAMFTGFAFYTKGPACFVLLPGFLFYLMFRKKLKLFKDGNLWLSICLFMLIAGSWLYIGLRYGKTSEHSVYGSKNSIETMLIYDTYQRLTNPKFDNAPVVDNNYSFFLQVTDARLNLWSYFFFLAILIGLNQLYKNKKDVFAFINQAKYRMTLLSICLIAPLSLILTFASTKHNWYLASVFMFIAFIIIKGIIYVAEKWKGLYFITGLLLVFTFLRQVYYVYTLPTSIHEALAENEKIRNQRLVMVSDRRQDIFLYLKWLNVKILNTEDLPEALKSEKKLYILTSKKLLTPAKDLKIIAAKEFDNYIIGEIKKIHL